MKIEINESDIMGIDFYALGMEIARSLNYGQITFTDYTQSPIESESNEETIDFLQSLGKRPARIAIQSLKTIQRRFLDWSVEAIPWGRSKSSITKAS